MAKIEGQSFSDYKKNFNDPKENNGQLSEEEFCFEDCTFDNSVLIFNSPYVRFTRCKFKGLISISNKGIRDGDDIHLIEIEPDNELIAMGIVSPSIALENVNIVVQNGLIIEGSEVDIKESIIEGSASLKYVTELTVTHSDIDDVKIIHITGDQDEIAPEIASTTIKGR